MRLASFGDQFYDLRVYDVSHFKVSDEFELGGLTLVARVRSAGNDERRASSAGSLALDFDFLADAFYVVMLELRTVSSNGHESDLFNTVRLQDPALSSGVQMSALSGHDYALTAPVPEPSTQGLLLAGMLVTTSIRRRRA